MHGEIFYTCCMIVRAVICALIKASEHGASRKRSSKTSYGKIFGLSDDTRRE